VSAFNYNAAEMRFCLTESCPKGNNASKLAISNGTSKLISMNFHIVTLFPATFDSYLKESILKRAIEDKKIKVKFYNPRDYTLRLRSGQAKDKHARVDRPPYGGGPGMVIQAEPVIKAVEAALRRIKNKELRIKNNHNSKFIIHNSKIIFLSPSGKQFTNKYAEIVSKKYTDIIIVSGRYEGIDARIKKVFKMEDISVGPFVLTGGELPAMILIDCLSRQVKGVLGNFDSIEENRVSTSEVYTRPEVFLYKGKKYKVPKILLSGHKAKIEEWKRAKNKAQN
jgi:tRNA (guanine37-N1)-methyltransferase